MALPVQPQARNSAMPRASAELRQVAEQMFARAGGAPLGGGNAVRVLRDAGENYPAWLSAIAGARRSVLFENYTFTKNPNGPT